MPATSISTLIAEQNPATGTETALLAISEAEREAREARREAAALEMLRESRRQDGIRRWQEFFPPAIQSTDWAHPALVPYASPIAAVRGYQLGAKGILASGPSGRGKTRSMAALMRRLGQEDGNDVRYWSAMDWFSTLQSCLDYGRDSAQRWVEATASRHVVLFDDYGQEALSTSRRDWAQAWFFHFLDYRVSRQLPLFVTTNLSAREIMAHSGPARGDPLVRRLLDLCEPIQFR